MILKDVKFEWVEAPATNASADYAFYQIVNPEEPDSTLRYGKLTFVGDVADTAVFFIQTVTDVDPKPAQIYMSGVPNPESGRTITLTINESSTKKLTFDIENSNSNIVCDGKTLHINPGRSATFTYLDGAWYCISKRMF